MILQIYLLVSGAWSNGIAEFQSNFSEKALKLPKKASNVPNKGEQGRTETTTIVGVLAVQNQDKCAICSKLFINDTLPMFNGCHCTRRIGGKTFRQTEDSGNARHSRALLLGATWGGGSCCFCTGIVGRSEGLGVHLSLHLNVGGRVLVPARFVLHFHIIHCKILLMKCVDGS